MLPLLVPATLLLAQVPVVQRADDGRLVARSAGYEARFDAAGLEFEGGDSATLSLGAVELRRGDTRLALATSVPTAEGALATFERAPGVCERFAATPAGIEHSLVVDGPFGTDGDLVVRVALGGTNAALGERRSDGSHSFGGITYGHLFGIDANGERTDGDVRLVDGGLELVIADAWLDTAAWPITLDPLVAWNFDITSQSSDRDDGAPDVAYDATEDVYLAVWERTSSVGARTVHARRFRGNGTLVGSEILLSNSTAAHQVRVANSAASGRFVVSWLQDTAANTELRAVAVSASSGAKSNEILIAAELLGTIDGHDIAGDTSDTRAHLIWRSFDGIHHTRVTVPLGGAGIAVTNDTVIVPDNLQFISLREPTVSRTTTADGRLAVAWVRDGLISGDRNVYAMVIDRSSSVVNAPLLVSTDEYCNQPSIDGGGVLPTRFVLSWSNDEPIVGTALRVVALASSSTLTIGAPVTLGVFGSAPFLPASVGWRPGTAYVAYEKQDSVRLATLDAASAAVLDDVVVQAKDSVGQTTNAGHEPALVMEASGGVADRHLGCVLWMHRKSGLQSGGGGAQFPYSDFWIRARALDAFSPLATVADLGGGCGSVGTIAVPQPPALGNGTFSIRLDAAPSATFGILNIAAPQTLLSCGACSFAAPATTYLVPIASQQAVVKLPIPANAALAGAQALAQWYVVAPGAAPCAFVPDFGASDILELTLN